MAKLSLLDFDLEFKNKGYGIIAGVDEAGRGPLAGPVFACAIIMKEENKDNIISGVNDSKKLSEKKREELYDIILENALCYCVTSVDEKKIDEINILKATMIAMDTAINNLKIKPDLVLIDGNYKKGIKANAMCIVKGDSLSYNIAAASIIAKVSRDRYIREMALKYPDYQFEKHKGYGTKLHKDAILKYGLCDIHRKTFCKGYE